MAETKSLAQTDLIGMAKVRELVETIIYTGSLKDYSPVSMGIIAVPESGKTSIALAKSCKTVTPLTDVTGRGIQKLCLTRPEVTHFVLNDLLAVSAKKAHVMQATIVMLNAMMEEGIRATAYPDGVQVFEDGKRAVILCMTPVMATDQRSWWNRTGFSSRLFPFCFEHGADLEIKIHAAIRMERARDTWVNGKRVELLTPIKMRVQIKQPYSARIEAMAKELGERFKEHGYRRHNQLRAIACAHALRRSWKSKQVDKADIEFLEWLLPFASYHIATPL
jgi:hypothetical protein